MKLQKQSTKKPLKILTVSLALVLALVTVWYIQASSDSGEPTDYTNTSNTTDENENRSPNTNDEKNEPAADSDGDKPATPQGSREPEDPGFISSPISNPPAVNDPYPIENEHYKIAKRAERSYHITLYPIANNPDYSNYSAQLRAYKDEALSYLKERYGNIDSFTFTWSPEDAKNV